MSIRKTLALACLLTMVVASASVAGEAKVEVTGIDIALVDLETPLRVGATTHRQAYLVRIQGTFPAAGAALLRLYFGDAPIEAYGDYPGGLYFSVVDKAQLDAWHGKTLRWRVDDGELHDTGRSLDVKGAEPFTVMPEKAALLR